MTTRGTGRGYAVGISRLAGLLAAALALSALAVGCGGSGSTTTTTTAKAGTGKQPYVLVPVLNDTPSTVKFLQCLATCAETHERRTIPPGGTTTVVGSNDNVKFSYLVEDSAGKRLGCVQMQFNHVATAPQVHISSMTSCE